MRGPQGLKPGLFCDDDSARLKPCPDEVSPVMAAAAAIEGRFVDIRKYDVGSVE